VGQPWACEPKRKALAASLFSAATVIRASVNLLCSGFGSAVRDQLGGHIPTRRKVGDAPTSELDSSDSLLELLVGHLRLGGHQLNVVPRSV
jgi:hypothetical protein